ncbi:MAG TPA: hypothetical protein PKH77_08885 [Anaerolineae bacterium]|nr:hypothetical protein [Anaerolineae bacterium]
MSFEADALAELKKPRTKESTLAKKLALFLGSLAAFLLLGLLAISSSSKVGIVDLLGIVLILFVHESGHYLSMRWLGYRNVQMFFIPFFGAAVSGYSTPMPIFHQAFVILAGPIPGIFRGSHYGANLSHSYRFILPLPVLVFAPDQVSRPMLNQSLVRSVLSNPPVANDRLSVSTIYSAATVIHVSKM